MGWPFFVTSNPVIIESHEITLIHSLPFCTSFSCSGSSPSSTVALSIRNLAFQRCKQSALSVKSIASVTLEDVAFSNNSNPGFIGGAASLTEIGNVQIIRCNFTSNTAGQAGALLVRQVASATVEQSLFKRNRAQGEMLEAMGGGLDEGVTGATRRFGGSVVFDSVQEVSLLDSTFKDNKVGTGAKQLVGQA